MDDPSGIATYSQVSAQFGYGLAMATTMNKTGPIEVVVQSEIDAPRLSASSAMKACTLSGNSRQIRRNMRGPLQSTE
jgi:hypothetical protein